MSHQRFILYTSIYFYLVYVGIFTPVGVAMCAFHGLFSRQEKNPSRIALPSTPSPKKTYQKAVGYFLSDHLHQVSGRTHIRRLAILSVLGGGGGGGVTNNTREKAPNLQHKVKCPKSGKTNTLQGAGGEDF